MRKEEYLQESVQHVVFHVESQLAVCRNEAANAANSFPRPPAATKQKEKVGINNNARIAEQLMVDHGLNRAAFPLSHSFKEQQQENVQDTGTEEFANMSSPRWLFAVAFNLSFIQSSSFFG